MTFQIDCNSFWKIPFFTHFAIDSTEVQQMIKNICRSTENHLSHHIPTPFLRPPAKQNIWLPAETDA